MEVGGRRVGVVRIADRLPYSTGLTWQRELARARIEGRLARDLLLLLEHEPVVTVGRGGEEADGLWAGSEGPEPEIPRFEIERGGEATYHGPGQLVGYPILDLGGFRKDLHWYLRQLEDALIRALESLGVTAGRVPHYTGVWVGALEAASKRSAVEEHEDGGAGLAVQTRIAAGDVRKIASIGVHVSRWVTWHGFALNVTDEALAPFNRIVPCGIAGVRMTSLESEGAATATERVLEAVEKGFSRAFDVPLEPIGIEVLAREGFGLPPAGAGAGQPGAIVG